MALTLEEVEAMIATAPASGKLLLEVLVLNPVSGHWFPGKTRGFRARA
jgi:hypothetical protein